MWHKVESLGHKWNPESAISNSKMPFVPHQVAQYTLIRFVPQVDAGEFANIGVVLSCPGADFFEYRLISQRQRVMDFFKHFGDALFARVLQETEAELNHVRTQVQLHGARDQVFIVKVMQDLTSPRETMIRYSPTRMLLAADMNTQLSRLVGRYVECTDQINPTTA